MPIPLSEYQQNSRILQEEMTRLQMYTRSLSELQEETGDHNVFLEASMAAATRASKPAPDSIWKGGQEPLPFDEFCVALDGQPLFDRQADAFALAQTLRAAHLFSPSRSITEWVLIWGKRCLAGDTPLRDEASGVTRTLREWAWLGCPLLVSAYVEGKAVQRWATPAFKKGRSQLWRVRLSDGREFRATAEHQCLTPDGWTRVGALRTGMMLLTAPRANSRTPGSERGKMDMGARASHGSRYRHSEQSRATGPAASPAVCGTSDDRKGSGYTRRSSHSLASRHAYAPHATNKGAGFPVGYHPSARLYDARPLPGPGNDPVPAPLPTDARAYNHYWHVGVLASAPAHIPTCQSYGHARPISQTAYPAYEQCSPALSGSASGSTWEYPVVATTHQSSALPRTEPQRRSCFVGPFSTLPYKSSVPYGFPHYTTIVDIKEDTYEDYYDLTVPDAHCYFDANGILHHNSGKDYTIAKFLAWNVYVLHRLAVDPCKYMSDNSERTIAPGSRLDMINVAPDAALASQVFFNYLKMFLSHEYLRDIPVSPAPSAWKSGTDEIVFPEYNLHAYSKSSRASGIDGYNVFRGIIDEGDEFPVLQHLKEEGKNMADVIHGVFRRTAHLTFANFGMLVNISYPRYEEGYMLRLEQRALKANARRAEQGLPPSWFVDKAATNVIRPDVDINDPEIQEEFDVDPRGASAMYLVTPMSGEHSWVEFPEKINQAVDNNRLPIIQVTHDVKDCSLLKNDSGWRVVTEWSANADRMLGRKCFLGADSGKSRDAFAIAVYSIVEEGNFLPWLCPQCGADREARQNMPYKEQGHRDAPPGVFCGLCSLEPEDINPLKPTVRGWWHIQHEGGKTIHLRDQTFTIPEVREELIFSVKPVHKNVGGAQNNAVVDFVSLRHLCKYLIDTLPIAVAGFDPWQSTMFTQLLQGECSADIREVSMSNPEQFRRACIYKAVLYQSLIRNLPHPHRDREVKRLEHKGNSIDHPPKLGESKDLYDAEAIAVYLALENACPDFVLSMG